MALVVKSLPNNAGDFRDAYSIPGWGRSPGGGHSNSLQYSCQENPCGQRSLVNYSPCAVFSVSVMSHSLQPHGPHGLQSTRLLCPWRFSRDSLKNTGVGCHALLQGIFPTQGLNPSLWHCRQILYHLSHQGSPINSLIYTKIKYMKYVFLSWNISLRVINGIPKVTSFSRSEP